MTISFDEYMKDAGGTRPILTPGEYMGTDPVPKVLSPEQYEKGLTKPKMEEQSFVAKHPNLYGVFGAAQSLVPYIKYIDPEERERFAKLSTQKQTRELLLQNLETVAMVGAPVVTKGLAPIVAKYLPKTYKAFQFIKTPIKEWGKLAGTPAKEVAGAGVERAASKVVPRAIEIPEPQAASKAKVYESAKQFEDDVRRGLVTDKMGRMEELQPKTLLTRQEVDSIEAGKIPAKARLKYHLDRPQDEPILVREYITQAGETRRHIVDGEHRAIAQAIKGENVKAVVLKTGTDELSTYLSKMWNWNKSQSVGIKDPVQKITAAIKEAKPIRKAQETIYSEERGKRIGQAMAVGKEIPGEAGYHAQLGKLKGELPKVEFESIRGKVGQEDIDALFNIVNESVDVTGFQNITAKAGLAKLLGEHGVRVPTAGELTLLRKIFPDEFIKTLVKKRTSWEKIKEASGQLLNIPRSIMSSFDLSAPFRQGLFLGPSHPKRFMQAFTKMFKPFGSKKAFQALHESIAQKPTYQLMKDAGLVLTDMGDNMLMREERFMSQWAEKIPLVGIGVRASSRAYQGFLNKLRADVFEDLVLKAERLGLKPQKNMDLTKSIAKFVNAAAGRGSLGALEDAAIGLNAVFFSPRLMASRLTLLNPIYYVKADPFVRKEALKSLLTLAGGIGTVLGLARAGGARVGIDWRSADFGKIRIGHTRIDMMGGFQQYIRAAGQLITGEYVSSTTGKVITLGEGYRPLTRLEILYRQIESKEAPVFSFITTMLKGQDVAGNKLNVPKEIGARFVPMALQDIHDIAKEDPTLLPLSGLGIFGVGLQTYKPRSKTTKGIGPIKR